MKITTKTGDNGQTSLYDGTQVAKDDPRVELMGEVDELCALLGLCKATGGEDEPYATLQQQLKDFMAIIARNEDKKKLSRLGKAIVEMEAYINKVGEGLTFQFELPGKSALDALLHLSRAKARTCERRFATVLQSEPYPLVLQVYLNRLSDYLFALIINMHS